MARVPEQSSIGRLREGERACCPAPSRLPLTALSGGGNDCGYTRLTGVLILTIYHAIILSEGRRSLASTPLLRENGEFI